MNWLKDLIPKSRPDVKKIILYLTCFSVFLTPLPLRAETKTFIREYSYEASEMDSKITCRTIALEQVKRLLLEELGTYLESITVVRNYQIERDEITTLTAGVVQTTILEERWDGREYWLKAKITADPDEVASSIAQLRNNQQLAKDLAEARDEASQALRQIEALRQQLAAAETSNEKREEYKNAVNTLAATDWFERGQYLTLAGNYQEAVRAYGRVVVLRPNDAKAYSNRGAVYIQLGKYDSAAKDLDKAAALNPQNRTTLYNRNLVHKKLQETRSARIPQRDIPLKKYGDKVQQIDKEKKENADRLKAIQDRERQGLNRSSDRQLKERNEQLRKERQLTQRKRLEDKLKQKEQREDLRKKRELEEKKKKQKKREQPKQRKEEEKGRN